ncbi:uncharacterized protein N7515_008142 [Penicillium bovifimosum]|uniref:Transcription factor domain-containing protein n=1 Tax=Penicillium bovifimosum TaxID=126998 RepID=A0A9W9KX79_9EURO|nr:uncharacterized protein N7515_008142 [Penicillium bovifimosum]KAJ5124317.1 hypothetical protein N7515_008142 [Penicillium bovifimosum]
MSGNQHSPTGLPAAGEGASLLALLEQEYSDLSREMEEENLSPGNRILLDGVGLELRVFYFPEICIPEIRRKGLLRAYNTAQALIVKIRAADEATNLMSYSPSAFYRLTILAALVILKIINSSYSNFVDTESGKSTFISALSLIRQSSVEDNDLPGRASKILAQLWSFQSQRYRNIEDPSIRLTTRSSASVLHDSLWMWRDRFGGQSSGNNSSSDGTEAETSARMWNTRDPQAVHEADPLDSSNIMDCMFDLGMPAFVSWEFERNLGHFPPP